jgi:hypothetical protein
MATDRIFILDRSGSMDECRDDTIGGFNAFVESQVPNGGSLTLVLFDNEYDVVYKDKPIAEVEKMTRETFVPRGSTSLLDAIGKTLKGVTDLLPRTVVILTDGQENTSRDYTKAHIKDLVEAKTKEGWTFVYLGANQDAFAEAGSMGISQNCTMNYDVRRTPQAFNRLGAALSAAASCRGQAVDLTPRPEDEEDVTSRSPPPAPMKFGGLSATPSCQP